MMIDPVLSRACGAAISIILLVGAWQKLRDLERFEAALANYRLLPEFGTRVVARSLVLLEAAAGATLLWEPTRSHGTVMATALLVIVTAAVAINLIRGRRDIDCGCGGLSGDPSLSWGLVARNGLLLAAVLIGSQDGTQRPLVWMDDLSVGAATLALLGLYVAANQLMANLPRLAILRR